MRASNQRGSILMLSYLLAASTLLVLAQVAQVRTLTETADTTQFVNSQLARQTAESGLQDAMARFAADAGYRGTDPNWTCADPAMCASNWTALGTTQQFRTQIAGSTSPYTILSQARVSGAIRTLTAFAALTNSAPFQFALFGNSASGSYAAEVNWNAVTNSYNSSTNTNPATFMANGHVGTNSTSASAIYVHNNALVNGNAQSGANGNASIAITTAGGGSIMGARTSLLSTLNYLVLSVTQTNYPFAPTSSASPNAAGTDPNDWKNPLIALPTAWQSEISGKKPTNSGGTLLPSTISGYQAYSGCSYFVSGLLTVNPGATLDFTGGGACPSGVKLRVGNVFVQGTIRGVTQLLVNDAGSYDARVVGGSIQFSGPDPILWSFEDVSPSGRITSFFPTTTWAWASITGVKYLYAGRKVYLDSASTVSFTGAGSLLYTPGNVVLAQSGSNTANITGIERVYAGWPVTSYSSAEDATVAVWGTNSQINFTSSPAATLYSAGDTIIGRGSSMSNLRYLYGGRHYLTDSLSCMTSTCGSFGPSVLTFDPAGMDNLFYIEDGLYIRYANSAIYNVNRLYGGSRQSSTGLLLREVTNYPPPIYFTFTGSHPTLYGYGQISIGPNAIINGLEHLYARNDVYYNICNCMLPSLDIESWSTGYPEYLTFGGSNATIFTQGSIQVKGPVSNNIVTHSSNRPTDLLISSTASGGMNQITLIGSLTRVNAAVYAPQIPIIINTGAQLYGAATGRTTSLTDANSRVHYDETLASKSYNWAPASVKLLAIREQ